MKILLGSYTFPPNVGGIESSSLDLASAFARAGHKVLILTQTSSRDIKHDHGLNVLRRPSAYQLACAFYWCDIFFQNNISLSFLWPLLFFRRPWFVTTQTWIRRDKALGRIKQYFLRWASNIYISSAIAEHIDNPGRLIPNPYNDKVFKLYPTVQRRAGVVFVGRLEHVKGCDLLVDALARLKNRGLIVPLTIVGDGTAKHALREQVTSAGLDDHVSFAGLLLGEMLAREINRHTVMVVPSRWAEPFGIVALEGIACGCAVIASKYGGLSDAIGACGKIFPNGDVDALAEEIALMFLQPDSLQHCRSQASAHLNRHKIDYISRIYLDLFEKSHCLK